MLYFSDVVYYQEKLMEYSFLSMIYVFSIVHDQEINCEPSSLILEKKIPESKSMLKSHPTWYTPKPKIQRPQLDTTRMIL